MIKEFEIYVPDEKIELLNQKIDLTRWPDEIEDGRWTLGTDKSFFRKLLEHGDMTLIGESMKQN